MTTGNKRRPVIGKLLTTGQRSGSSVEAGSSPRSPLDLKIVSPRGVLMKCDLGGGGVGLGLVAALSDHFIQPDINEEDEEYTIVTRHMPNNNSYIKVYDGKAKTCGCVFDISPVIRVDVKGGEFLLSSCHECNKGLEGRDVYMYRGERAYCSVECRDRAMWMEERSCTSEAASTSDILSSTTTTGIFAI